MILYLRLIPDIRHTYHGGRIFSFCVMLRGNRYFQELHLLRSQCTIAYVITNDAMEIKAEKKIPHEYADVLTIQ